MTVEEVKLQEKANSGNGAKDPFPSVMRVLAVKGDHTCLEVLENLLLRCRYQYHDIQGMQTVQQYKLRLGHLLDDCK